MTAAPTARVLRGTGVGDGLVIGPVWSMGRFPDLGGIDIDPAVELGADAALRALAAVGSDLGNRAQSAADPTAAAVLEALAMIATDPEVSEQVTELVEDGTSATRAVVVTFDGYRDILAASGGYLAERAADIDDIRDRVVATMLGVPLPGLPRPGVPFVLAAEDLSPADTAGLDTASVLALVTERGGMTSHTAIVARSLGLPCVVACAGITAVPDGTVVAVDALEGTVEVSPDAERTALLRATGDDRTRGDATTGPGGTLDGHRIEILLNIGSAADLEGRLDAGVEGVGLFRTEFLFLSRAVAPPHDEQRRAYRQVLEAAGGRKVVVRTLDAGADKPLPFVALGPGANPALGIRGFRTHRHFPDLLPAQLNALASAARDVPGSDVWVMAPMISTPAEAAEFAGLARGAGLSRVGVMIEVPSAALLAAEILAEVDFLSVGTNDLAQYTLAADRLEGDLAALCDPRQPALLRLVGMCADAGHAAGKPVGVCGEAAADPSMAAVFCGLGVTSLSMSAPATRAVRASLARTSLAECTALAVSALAGGALPPTGP